MALLLGSDHRGFTQKKRIHMLLQTRGVDVQDMGDTDAETEDDYPVFAKAVALTISEKKAEKGILFCGSGVGMSIVANKFPSIRAGLCFSVEQVKAARHDDDINILVLAVDYLEEHVVDDIVIAFLETPFSSEEKYARRIKQIADIEELVKTYA